MIAINSTPISIFVNDVVSIIKRWRYIHPEAIGKSQIHDGTSYFCEYSAACKLKIMITIIEKNYGWALIWARALNRDNAVLHFTTYILSIYYFHKIQCEYIFLLPRMHLCFESDSRLSSQILHGQSKLIDKVNGVYNIPGCKAFGDCSALAAIDTSDSGFRKIATLAKGAVNTLVITRKGQYQVGTLYNLLKPCDIHVISYFIHFFSFPKYTGRALHTQQDYYFESTPTATR